MKIEKRNPVGSKPFAIFIAENEEESKILDEVFGDTPSKKDFGLLGTGRAEIRLADGAYEHYVRVHPD